MRRTGWLGLVTLVLVMVWLVYCTLPSLFPGLFFENPVLAPKAFRQVPACSDRTTTRLLVPSMHVELVLDHRVIDLVKLDRLLAEIGSVVHH